MRSGDIGIGEALTRIAETFGRLVAQHLQLLRSEAESEARALAGRGRSVAILVARAFPFVLGGIVVASVALGQLLGLLVEPVLGRAATPVMSLILGIGEAALAGAWLKTHLPPTGVEGSRRTLPPGETSQKSPEAPGAGVQEKAYGAVG